MRFAIKTRQQVMFIIMAFLMNMIGLVTALTRPSRADRITRRALILPSESPFCTLCANREDSTWLVCFGITCSAFEELLHVFLPAFNSQVLDRKSRQVRVLPTKTQNLIFYDRWDRDLVEEDGNRTFLQSVTWLLYCPISARNANCGSWHFGLEYFLQLFRRDCKWPHTACSSRCVVCLMHVLSGQMCMSVPFILT